MVPAGDEEEREHHERVEDDDAEGGILVGVGDLLALALGVLGPEHDGREGDSAESAEAVVAGVVLVVRDPHLVERPEGEDHEYEEQQEVVPHQLEPEHDALAEFALHLLLFHPDVELLRGLLRVVRLHVRLQSAHARQCLLQHRGFVQSLLHLTLARSGSGGSLLLSGFRGAQPTAGARALVPWGLGVDILDVDAETTVGGGCRRRRRRQALTPVSGATAEHRCAPLQHVSADPRPISRTQPPVSRIFQTSYPRFFRLIAQ